MRKKEELPEYFNNITFERRSALIGAISYINNIPRDRVLRHPEKIKNYDDVSLLEIIEDNKIDKKTRQKLITFGKVLGNMLNSCGLAKKTHISGSNHFVIMQCLTKKEKPAYIRMDHYNNFSVIAGDIIEDYKLLENYNSTDDFSEAFICCYDNDYNVNMKKVRRIVERELDDSHFIKLVTSEENCSFSVSQGDQRLEIEIDNLSLSKPRLDNEEGVLYSITNLKLPVNIISYLNDIANNFIINRASNIFINQYCSEELQDSIEIGKCVLENCSITDQKNNSHFIINKDGYTYIRDYDSCSSVRCDIKNDDELQTNIIISTPRGNLKNAVAPISLLKESDTVYKKTLEKIPNWIKRN